MPKKRRNGGKSRHNRGSVDYVRCDISGVVVPKDKAIRRYTVRYMINASGMKDLKDASYYDRFQTPKLYHRANYCISNAMHQTIVKPRSRKERKKRQKPFLRLYGKNNWRAQLRLKERRYQMRWFKITNENGIKCEEIKRY